MSASLHSDRDRRLSTAGSRLRPQLGRLEQGALALAALGALYAIWLGVGLPAIPIGPGDARSDPGTPWVTYIDSVAPTRAIAGAAIPARKRPNRHQSRPLATSAQTVSPPPTNSQPRPVETTRQAPTTTTATPAPIVGKSSSASTTPTPPPTTPSTPAPPTLPDVPSLPLPQLPSVPEQPLPQTPPLPQVPALPAALPPTPPVP